MRLERGLPAMDPARVRKAQPPRRSPAELWKKPSARQPKGRQPETLKQPEEHQQGSESVDPAQDQKQKQDQPCAVAIIF